MKKILFLSYIFFTIPLFSQKDLNINALSLTRNFVQEAEFVQINKNWNVLAEFESGIGESVIFYPIEAIDLKTSEKIKALQMEMEIKVQSSITGKSAEWKIVSWVDLDDIDELIFFLETYVIPNLKDRTDNKEMKEYIFNSKEIVLNFRIKGKGRRISIYYKNSLGIDNERFFWTETQVDKIPKLLEVLKIIK
jgi:hypothetical protein